MATRELNRVVRETVTICDRCDGHAQPVRHCMWIVCADGMDPSNLGTEQIADKWGGNLCRKCAEMLTTRIQHPARRTRKTKEV